MKKKMVLALKLEKFGLCPVLRHPLSGLLQILVGCYGQQLKDN